MRKRLRVLIADPCADTRSTLAQLLHLWGYQVRQARNGPAALEMAEAYQPDVVLTELCLPGLDGYALARRLRERRGGEVLLVAVTGYGGDRYCRLSTEAGFDHHFVKPADPEELRDFLDYATREAETPYLVRISESRVGAWEGWSLSH